MPFEPARTVAAGASPPAPAGAAVEAAPADHAAAAPAWVPFDGAGPGEAAEPAAKRSIIQSTMPRTVLIAASSSTTSSSNSPEPASTNPNRCANSPRISVRLIESIDRSASRSRSGSNISTG